MCCGADVTIEVSQKRQTIRHFGASDAWSMQFIGLWENQAEQEKIADWLFSLESDAQGKPKGINTNLFMQVYDMPAPQVKDASKLLKNKLLSTYLYDISTQADKVVHITL